MSDDRKSVTTIPRTLPTREEIADLAERDVTVAVAIGEFRSGRVTYEDSLRIAVVGLASIAERAIAELTQRDGARGVVYISPERDWPPQPATTRWRLVVLVAAALTLGFGLGVFAARMLEGAP
ncbi:MAG: hypothetical protein WBC44_04620 [Planctomycetaceae bacterium]